MSRNTIQQDIILSTVKDMTDHPSSDEVFAAVHEKYPSIGRSTVYRVLKKLSDKGCIKKVTIPNTADRFDCRTDVHLHLRCIKCNRVFDIDTDDSEAIMEKVESLSDIKNISDIKGFKIDKVNFSFEGVCSRCQKNEQDDLN